MNPHHVNKIAEELSLRPSQVLSAGTLLAEGATVPFIARYRKEATGSLDEVAITGIRDRMGQLQERDARREVILRSLEERQLLTDPLRAQILAAETLTTLEDLYLPYRPKRRTRAMAARERGLEPLADLLLEQSPGCDPLLAAGAFVDQEKGVASPEEALQGARDIVAERISEDQKAREAIRDLFLRKGRFQSRVIEGKEETGAKFRDYFDWEETVSAAPSHRVLAMRRGEKEEVLDLRILVEEEEALQVLGRLFLRGDGPASREVETALVDGYRRLLFPSMETEVRLETKKRADRGAIRTFAENLRELLLSPPLGQKRVLAIDPGIRTGCKACCLDAQGGLLEVETVFLFQSDAARAAAAKTLRRLMETHAVEAVALGNGTGGRETEAFLKGEGLLSGVPLVMVNESGASVYSASEVARREFPDLDVSYRGAVSIGRRLMDPLAELVKIEPKAIGVGQYQHDVNQVSLKNGLDDVVMSCVNAVGVEVNTASAELLTYVSGLGPQLARNIVAYRNENGPLGSREELKKISRLGPKAFEQAAGFLRIRNGRTPLDASAVHPEAYPIVEAMARDLDCSVEDLLKKEALRQRIELTRYVTGQVGLPTLTDILEELRKPGRDPRKTFEPFSFAEGITTLEDLRPGMTLPGIVTNVTAFGAFVDIGVHQDGLVHKSELADAFVEDPHALVKVHQRVTVTVCEVDTKRRRISLSMRTGKGPENKGGPRGKPAPPRPGAFNPLHIRIQEKKKR